MATGVSISLLGARGTASVEGRAFSQYGGATSCVLLRMGGEVIVLDGGTGLLTLDRHLDGDERVVHLLLSHGHFDHMSGMPSCPVFFDPTRLVHFYAAPCSGLAPRHLLERLMSPPLWPVGVEAFQAGLDFHTIRDDLHLGAVTVRIMEGAHPGGCTVFRAEYGGTSVVYASDYELDENTAAPLEDFCRDCTLLLCDGQYTRAEFEARRGYGHSDWSSAARLAQRCGAQQLRILHHAPWRTDEELNHATPALQALFPNSSFAYCEEVIKL